MFALGVFLGSQVPFHSEHPSRGNKCGDLCSNYWKLSGTISVAYLDLDDIFARVDLYTTHYRAAFRTSSRSISLTGHAHHAEFSGCVRYQATSFRVSLDLRCWEHNSRNRQLPGSNDRWTFDQWYWRSRLILSIFHCHLS